VYQICISGFRASLRQRSHSRQAVHWQAQRLTTGQRQCTANRGEFGGSGCLLIASLDEYLNSKVGRSVGASRLILSSDAGVRFGQ